ncbi:MAG: curli-like amyloid fiber formation chaperone CsgH [Pseudomonadota bacterium]
MIWSLPSSGFSRRVLIAGLLGMAALRRQARASDTGTGTRTGTGAQPDAEPTTVIAWIDVEQEGRITRFHAMASGLVDASVSFDLQAEIHSGGNRSRSRQSGRATLSTEQGSQRLSTLSLGIAADSAFEITLTVEGDKTAATATLRGGSTALIDL